MALHGGIDTAAFVSGGVYSETFGQAGLKNRCNLFALLGLLEDAPFPAPVSAVIRFLFKARGIFKFKKRPGPFSFKRRPRFIFEG